MKYWIKMEKDTEKICWSCNKEFEATGSVPVFYRKEVRKGALCPKCRPEFEKMILMMLEFRTAIRT